MNQRNIIVGSSKAYAAARVKHLSLRLVVVLFLFVSAVGVTSVTQSVGAQDKPTQQPPPINLSGIWKLDTGGTVVISPMGPGGLFAEFSPAQKCHGEPRTNLFYSAAPKVTSISGGDTQVSLGSQFWACTRDKKMIDDCPMTPVYVTKFRATVSPDGNTISGERFAEGWAFDEKDGKYVNCRLSSRYDAWYKFTLTRGNRRDCPGLQQGYEQAKGLLDTHDAQMETIKTQYNKLYGKLAGMQGEAKRLRANADTEWDEFVLDKFLNANIDIFISAIDPTPDFGEVFLATDALRDYVQTFQAHRGSIADLKTWARKQPRGSTDDMLRLLNYLDDMGGSVEQMAKLRNNYKDWQEKREPKERAANDAKAELDACLAGQ